MKTAIETISNAICLRGPRVCQTYYLNSAIHVPELLSSANTVLYLTRIPLSQCPPSKLLIFKLVACLVVRLELELPASPNTPRSQTLRKLKAKRFVPVAWVLFSHWDRLTFACSNQHKNRQGLTRCTKELVLVASMTHFVSL